MIRPTVFVAVLALIAASLPPLAVADEARPKIGLVLGGGGARGAAHIGVIRELERLRIPIDAIAGTSMGAIVGGLYASGVSSAELEKIVATLDWNYALSDTPLREDLSFRRKQDDERYPIGFELGYHDGELRLPQGVIQGHKLDLILRDLTMHAATVRDFDELPIPFRAVASDVERGDAHVMGGGDLALAIRASMSVPGIFAPVRVDDRLLVDGGIVGNLPIDVAHAMGVDVVIAVDVEFPLYALDELDSALAISEQMLTILIRKETRRQIATLGDGDVLLRPDLGMFPSTGFHQISDAIEPGAQAAQAQATRLAHLSLDETSYAEHLAARQRRPDRQREIGFVRVSQDGREADTFLKSRIEVAAQDPLDSSLLAYSADKVYGMRLYEKVGYRIVEANGELGVEFDATSKSWGPNFLRFGVGLEDDFEGSTSFNLRSRLWRPGLNARGLEFRGDLQLGTDPLLAVELYQPLKRDSRLFVAPHLSMGQFNLNTFDLDDSIARYRVSQFEAGIDAGVELGNLGELRFGLYRGAGDGRVRVGDPAVPNFDFDTGGVRTTLAIDTLDNARFPRSGTLANLNWNLSRPGLGADAQFDTVAFDATRVFSRGKSTLALGIEYATTLDAQGSIQDLFPLGGFLNLSGLERGQIGGPHAAVARAIYYRRVGDSAGGLIEAPMYLGASLEAGNVWQSRGDIGLDTALTHGSLFVGIDTFIGPLFLAAGIGENDNSNFYLFVGAPVR